MGLSARLVRIVFTFSSFDNTLCARGCAGGAACLARGAEQPRCRVAVPGKSAQKTGRGSVGCSVDRRHVAAAATAATVAAASFAFNNLSLLPNFSNYDV